MRILCICKHGNTRSHHVASVLKGMGHEALACGAETCSRETLLMLCHWAERIWMAEESVFDTMLRKGVAGIDHRTRVMAQIPDNWPLPHHEDLLKIAKGCAKRVLDAEEVA